MQIDSNCYTVEIRYKNQGARFIGRKAMRLEYEILTAWKLHVAELLGVSVGPLSIVMLFDKVRDVQLTTVKSIYICHSCAKKVAAKHHPGLIDIISVNPASRSLIKQFGARKDANRLQSVPGKLARNKSASSRKSATSL